MKSFEEEKKQLWNQLQKIPGGREAIAIADAINREAVEEKAEEEKSEGDVGCG